MREGGLWAAQLLREYGKVRKVDKSMQNVSRVWFSEHCWTPRCKIQSVGWDQLYPVLLPSCHILSGTRCFFIFIPSPRGWFGVLIQCPDLLNWDLLSNVIVLNHWMMWQHLWCLSGREDVTSELGGSAVGSLVAKGNITKIFERGETQFFYAYWGYLFI